MAEVMVAQFPDTRWHSEALLAPASPSYHDIATNFCASVPVMQSMASDFRAKLGEVGRLEREILTLTRRVAVTQRRLDASRSEAAEANDRVGQAAQAPPLAARARRQTDQRLAEVQTELQEALVTRAANVRDNKGLRRSVHALQARLANVGVKVRDCEETVVRADSQRDAALAEEASLRCHVGSMDDLQVTLEGRVAEEREARLRLKAAARLKLERVAAADAPLKEQLRQHELDIERWRAQQAEQEARTRAALADLAQARAEAAWAAAEEATKRDARLSLRREHAEARRAHDALQRQLEAAEARSGELAQNAAAGGRRWRSQHLEHLDARLDERRRLDREIVVADAHNPATDC